MNILPSQLLNKHLKLGQCCYYMLVLVLISSSLAITAGTIKLYFSNAVKNKIITNFVKHLEFPAITICNQLIAKRVPTCEIPASGFYWRLFSLLPKLEYGIWTKKTTDEHVFPALKSFLCGAGAVPLLANVRFSKFCPCPNNYEKQSMEQMFQSFNSANFYKILKEYCPSIDDQFLSCRYCHLFHFFHRWEQYI
uniref:Uncharacterized protein n=1 Tax=Romanomermis culicivorax TaxID=13658 RepID=A0A915I8H3_ROMCU